MMKKRTEAKKSIHKQWQRDRVSIMPTNGNIMKRTADADEKYQTKCVEFK